MLIVEGVKANKTLIFGLSCSILSGRVYNETRKTCGRTAVPGNCLAQNMDSFQIDFRAGPLQ